MGQTRWVSSTEATEVEWEAVDKGAITAPTPSTVGRAKYAAAEAIANATDKVEWPTKVSGQTEQGF
jgi:hypothetical protein